MRPWHSAAVGAALVLVAAGAALAVSTVSGSESVVEGVRRPDASAWQGLVGGVRPSVALGQRVIVLLKAPSLADRVRNAGGVAADTTQRRWTAEALASQEQLLAELAQKGIVARPGLRFTRVVNGFSAIADPSAVALLERSRRIAGVYPVRAGFPAQFGTDGQASGGSPLQPGLDAFPGRGITVALLDTAVDPATPYLHGRVLPGVDVIAGGVAARYDQRPGGKRLEAHGTTMAGVVVGLGAPGRPSGAASAAMLLPIRVAGWQRDAVGTWSIHSRTDQIIAGLERAVDPDRDGDAQDAARVALVPLVEPFAAFPDGPLALAVEGATTLDTLVVTPAGNDGPGGPAFGSIAGPGGAPAALTVGSVDMRPSVQRVPALVRRGVRVLSRRPLDLLTGTAPASGTVELVPVRSPDDLYGQGTSRVAGRAALFTRAIAPRSAAALAADAGAAVVVLAGERLPAGALGLRSHLAVPVLAADPTLVAAVRRASEGKIWLSTGEVDAAASAGIGRPASFTSWGLAFGGQLKPDLAAPGVAVPSVVPGADRDGRSLITSVNGGSAAAAVTAGLAARLAEARPALDAAGLRSALVGTAHPLGRGSTLAQGMGMADAVRAAEVELVTDPAGVSFGRVSGDGSGARRPLVLRNVSTRALTVYLAPRSFDRGVVVSVSRGRVDVPAGATARVWLRARLVRMSGAAVASGIVEVAPRGSRAIRVPWTVVLSPRPDDLIVDAALSEKVFAPSDLTPVVLSVRLGTVERNGAHDAIEPVRRFDVLLEDDRRRPLGLLARLRDALPGRYAFGITGRSPDGRPLPRGAYALRLVAWPSAGGRAVVRVLPFGVE